MHIQCYKLSCICMYMFINKNKYNTKSSTRLINFIKMYACLRVFVNFYSYLFINLYIFFYFVLEVKWGAVLLL
jgi:hypothetical protein